VGFCSPAENTIPNKDGRFMFFQRRAQKNALV